MILKTDCKYFPGNKPCLPNKMEGVLCPDCNYYEPVKNKILIIKLDATGDVLRTTSLLPALKEKYPDSYITWVTRKNAEDIFKNNKLVDEVLIFEDSGTLPRLLVEQFDLLIHPDASPVSATLASVVNAKEKKGYILDKLGKIQPVNKDAVEWLEMGAIDKFKKENKKTYQQIIHEICGLEYKRSEILLFLSEEEIEFKKKFYKENNLDRFDVILGLNTGAGSRWQFKQWGLDRYVELIEMMNAQSSIGILLYGGHEEKERNDFLKNKFPFLIDTGTGNSLREFFALLDLSDIVLTGDTMALHAATALKKQVICLFGPTSYNEIEDYGRITKIIPQLDCLVCYKPRCDFKVTCMGEIKAGAVHNSIMKIQETLLKDKNFTANKMSANK